MIYGAAAFSALFPAPSTIAPTPVATPSIGFISDGRSFEAPIISNASDLGPGTVQARRLLALSSARNFLSNVTATLEFMSVAGVQEAHSRLKKRENSDIMDAIKLLLEDWPDDQFHEEDLLTWYVSFVGADFRRQIGSHLNAIWNEEDGISSIAQLVRTCEILYYSQRIYSLAVTEYMITSLQSGVDIDHIYDQNQKTTLSRAAKFAKKFSKSLHSIFIDTLPSDQVYTSLTSLTFKSCSSIFRVNNNQPSKSSSKYEITHEASLQLMQLFENLKDVGLGGDRAVRAFALAMEELFIQFVQSQWMEVDWIQQQPVVTNLTVWVEKAFTPFVKRAIICLTGSDDFRLNEESKQWLDMAIGWLGKSRIDKLFDFICVWPKSAGAILDIKAYAKTPEARKYLTLKFQKDVERRLLHAGATTKHILDIYMLTIQVFTALDSRGVLLDNVSRPIRKYLKNRADTAKVIISSMLADANDAGIQNTSDISKAIADEMLKPINLVARDMQRQDYDLDYDNMNYVPQPNDASPDFKRNESNEAIAHLLSLYDRDQYVTVLKNILGEHLLKATDDIHLEKETYLLEVFKARFGEERMQACEVMLRDIIISQRLNKKINSMASFRRGVQLQDGIKELNTQILSSFFWPELREDDFEVPEVIRNMKKLYETGFESHHNLMRLRWLPSLGRATIELHLQDRVITETVSPWVASVIDSFGSDSKVTATKSVEELEKELNMDEALVRNALAFWVGKQVLHESQPGRFSVLETLSDDQPAQAPGIMVQEEVSAVKSSIELLEENADMYRMFITGMLMNQGSMPLQRIHDMLRIALPGGFPFNANELKDLLQGMVNDSKLVAKGDAYSFIKH